MTRALLTDGTMSGVELTSSAFASVIPWFPYPLAVVIMLFAYSTMISWSYYGLEGCIYLFGNRRSAKVAFNAIFCAFVVIGCTTQLDAVLDFSDAMIFAMALANVLGLYLLAPWSSGTWMPTGGGSRTPSLEDWVGLAFKNRSPDRNVLDLHGRNLKRTGFQHGEVRPLARHDAADLLLHAQRKGGIDGDGAQRLLHGDPFRRRHQGAFGSDPVDGHPGQGERCRRRHGEV